MEPKKEKVEPNVTVVKTNELLGLVKKAHPNLLGKMPEKKAVGLVRATLLQMGELIDATKEGVVKVPGFGNFRVKQVEREKEGKKETVKKVAFFAAKTKPKK